MDSKKADLYIPRKCSATNRLISAKDHDSVQLNVGHVNEHGVYVGEYTTFALCGFIRSQGMADQAMNRLCAEHGLMKDLQSFPTHQKYSS